MAQERGKAYFFGRTGPQPSPSPTPIEARGEMFDQVSVALDRLLGTNPLDVKRACESSVFSPETRQRLSEQHGAHIKRASESWQLQVPHLRGAYEFLTRDFGGRVPPGGLSVRESQLQADWAFALGNALNRRLLVAYTAADYGEWTLANRVPANDLRDQRIVGIEMQAAFPVVDLEAEDWPDGATLKDFEVPYAMLQAGQIISVSRRVVLNNDVGVLARMIDNYGRAARRTVARTIWKLWMTNATYGGDSKAWFHTDHANLQAAALAKAEVIAAINKLLAQTEPGSGEKLGLRFRPGQVYLDVPLALWDAAYAINQEVGSALYHLFGADNEFILVNPLLAPDANDWGVHRSVLDVESVRASFFMGREEPTLLVADWEGASQMLVADKVQYKVTLEFGVAVAEYRGAVKAVVA